MTNSSFLNALELAHENAWFKSSYSGDNTGAGCVSIAVLADRIGIRDSKQSNGPAFTVPTTAWASFIREIQTDQHRPA
ncbi:DUF397 domain-containing protein [Streptomyces olivoreticuli]|uniref:DUF397 domain-containing protein n=1 Tax=Streptomyces olivoreticuli TaxID=68246 RepID=UPI0026596261|nr:DUF397 domain-containing protein [Streptomyces olivoreticuli]WKK21304.1 DUF397 domain-containing protein [Streptomyces olivoreticuli]